MTTIQPRRFRDCLALSLSCGMAFFLGVAGETLPAHGQGCCPGEAWLSGELVIGFLPGTDRATVDAIAEALDCQPTQLVGEIPSVTIYRICVPLGEELELIPVFKAFAEVRFAEPNFIGCGSVPPCTCCRPGLTCPSLPPCDPQAVIDADFDGFADSCDLCTDRDGDGFGAGGRDETCPADNCETTANPGQADRDGDGLGDACDPWLTVCHQPPGASARTTREIRQTAWAGHRRHGDVPGVCED